jgi:hypothetical protein
VARAQYEHQRLQRLSVFPISVDNKELEKVAEEVWWDLRERLTESKRFLVASRNFMQAKDAFQPRSELYPADVVILGRLLDANAVVTSFLKERRFSMRVYESRNGFLLWSSDVDLHPAVPVSKQMPDIARKLIYDFVSSIPYQGFVITDPAVGRASYFEGERLLAKADVGVGTQVTVGDVVQLVEIKATQIKPIFQEGANVEVYAQGRVVSVDRQIITIHIERGAKEKIEIKQGALVRIPDELRRIREMYGLSSDRDTTMSLDRLAGEEKISEEKMKQKPLVASLSWIGNLALILLLAF